MEQLPYTITREIVPYLGIRNLLSSRLVNRDWNLLITNNLRRRQYFAIELISTMELISFTHLMNSSIQSSFISKFSVDLYGMSLKSITSFVTTYGSNIRFLEFNSNGCNTVRDWTGHRMKLATFFKHSANLQLLTMDMSESRSEFDETWFPIYSHLKEIVFKRFATNCAQVLTSVVQRAPNLQILRVEYTNSADNERSASSFVHLLTVLPKNTKVHLQLSRIGTNNYFAHVECLNNLSGFSNTIHSIKIIVSGDFSPMDGPELEDAVEDLLTSQSLSLQRLEFEIANDIYEIQIPAIKTLESLTLGHGTFDNLTPEMFPLLSNLALSDSSINTFFGKRVVWTSVTILKLRSWPHDQQSCLTPEICSALPNLSRLELSTDLALMEDLKCCILHCAGLETLVLGFTCYSNLDSYDLWDVITGGTPRLHESTLLADQHVELAYTEKKPTLMDLQKLKTIIVNECPLHTVLGLLYLSKTGNFHLKYLELVLHRSMPKVHYHEYIDAFLKYHDRVVIKFSKYCR